MKSHVAEQVEALRDMTVAELREKYGEVFGETTTSRHKRFLQKRIAWGLQAREEGGLSERARQRARELTRDTDLRLLAPRGTSGQSWTARGLLTRSADRRLPMAGAIITREYKGQTISVTVLDNGFEYDGVTYRSLSAVARAVTGSRWNGFLFFQLGTKKGNA